MKNLKLFLVVVAMIFSSTISAKEIKNLANPDSVSVEVEKMLANLNVVSECEPIEVTLFFSVSEDQKIQSLSVASSNEEVKKYIQKELAGNQLPAGYWMKGKIYELTVVKRIG